MAGNRLGLTRERVRQLQQQVTDKMPDHPVFMPALDRALHILREKAPMSIEVASRTLAEERVTEKPFHPSSVLSAAETLRHPATFRIEQVRGRETLVASASDVMLLAKLASLARRQAEASGASNVAEVIAEAQKIPGVAADERTLRHALERDVQFLADDWFWAPEGKPERNRLRNVTRKMLSVTSDLDLTSIREGVRREYQSRGTRGIRTWRLIVPPRSVLRRFYDAHPEFSVDANDRVSSNEPLDYQIELSYTEQILVTVLRATPACLLDRTSLLRACIERGVNEATFSAYLSYSGFIEHLGKNLWTLRGVKVDPAAVEAVRVAVSSRPRERRVLSWGWTASGAIWIAARLPEQFSGLVVGVPAGSRPYLAGQGFRAYTEDEKACGTIRVREDGMSWGYGTFLAQSGADNDDILLATFDLSAESVSLAIINDERLAELEGDV